MALNFAQISRCVNLIVTSQMNTTGAGFRARSLTRRYHKSGISFLSTANLALLSRPSRCGWYPTKPMVGPQSDGLFCQATGLSHPGIPARNLKTCGPSGGAVIEDSPSMVLRALQGKKYLSYLTKCDDGGNRTHWWERSKLRRPRIVSSSATNLHSDFKVQKMFKSVMRKKIEGNGRTAGPAEDTCKITNQRTDLDLEKVKGEPSGNTGKRINPTVNRDFKNKSSKYKPNRTRTTFIKIPSDSKKVFDLSNVKLETMSQSVIPTSNVAVEMVKCPQTCMHSISSNIRRELTDTTSKATKKQLKETRQQIESTMHSLKRSKSCPENREVVEIYTERSGRPARKVLISTSATTSPNGTTKAKGNNTENPASETATRLVQCIQKGSRVPFAQNDFQINRSWDKIKNDIERFQDQRSSLKNYMTQERIGKAKKANIIEIRPRYVVNADTRSNRDVGPRLTSSATCLSRPDPRPPLSFADVRKANSRESRAASVSQTATSEFMPAMKNASQETGFILLDHQYTSMAKPRPEEKGFMLVNETGTAEKGFTLVKYAENPDSHVARSEKEHHNFVLANDNLRSARTTTEDSTTTTQKNAKLISTDGRSLPMLEPEVSGDAMVIGTSLFGNKELYSKTEQFTKSKLFNQNLNQPVGPSDSTEELKQSIRNNETIRIPTKISDCDYNLKLGSEPLTVKPKLEDEWTTTEVNKAEDHCRHFGNEKSNEKISYVSLNKATVDKIGSVHGGAPRKEPVDYSWTSCVDLNAEELRQKSAAPSHCHRGTDLNNGDIKEKSSRSGTPKKNASIFVSGIDPSGYILKGWKPTAATVSDLKPDLQKNNKKTQRKKSDSVARSRSEPQLCVKPEEVATAVKKNRTQITAIDKAATQSQRKKDLRTNSDISLNLPPADSVSVSKSPPKLTRQTHDKAKFEILTNKDKTPCQNTASPSSGKQQLKNVNGEQSLQNVNENKTLADNSREIREKSSNTSSSTMSQPSAHKAPRPIFTAGPNLELESSGPKISGTRTGKPEEVASAVKKNSTQIDGSTAKDKAATQSQRKKDLRTSSEISQKLTITDSVSVIKSPPKLTRQTHDKAKIEILTNKDKTPCHNTASPSSGKQPLQNVNDNKTLEDVSLEKREKSSNTWSSTKSQPSKQKTPPPIITTGRNLENVSSGPKISKTRTVKPEEVASAFKKNSTQIDGFTAIDKAATQSQRKKDLRTNSEISQKLTTTDSVSVTKSPPKRTRQTHDTAKIESLTHADKTPCHNTASPSSSKQLLQNVNENKTLTDVFRKMSSNTSSSTMSQPSVHKTPPPIITTGRNLELVRAIREQWSKDFQDTYRRFQQAPGMYSPDHQSNRNCSSTSSQALGRNTTKSIKNKTVRSKSPKSKPPQITMSISPSPRSPKKTETPTVRGMAERLLAASKQPAKTPGAMENNAAQSESSVTTFTDATITQGIADDFPDVDQFEEWVQNSMQETYKDTTKPKPNAGQEPDLPPKLNLPDATTKSFIFDPTQIKFEGSSVDSDLHVPSKRTSSDSLAKSTLDASSSHPSLVENTQDQETFKDSPVRRPSTASSPIDFNLPGWVENFPEPVPDRQVSPPFGWKQKHHQSRKDIHKLAASTPSSPRKDLRKAGELTKSASLEGSRSRNVGSLDGLVSMTVLYEKVTPTGKLKPTLKRSLSRERGEEKRVSFNPKLLNPDMLNVERKSSSSLEEDGEHAEASVPQHLLEDSSVGDMAARGLTHDLRKDLAQERKQSEMEARITLINKHTKQIKEYEAMLSKYRNVVSEFKDATMKNIKNSSTKPQPQKFAPD